MGFLSNKYVKLTLVFTILLMLTGLVKSYLTGFGLPGLVVGGFAIPVVEGFIIALLVIFIFKKWMKGTV